VSPCNYQATLCALVLEHRVGAGRGAMVNILEFALPVVLLLQDLARLDDAFVDTNGLVTRIRGDFCAYSFAI
jgi:hypothetical protein